MIVDEMAGSCRKFAERRSTICEVIIKFQRALAACRMRQPRLSSNRRACRCAVQGDPHIPSTISEAVRDMGKFRLVHGLGPLSRTDGPASATAHGMVLWQSSAMQAAVQRSKYALHMRTSRTIDGYRSRSSVVALSTSNMPVTHDVRCVLHGANEHAEGAGAALSQESPCPRSRHRPRLR